MTMTRDILVVVAQIVLLILFGALLKRVQILRNEHAVLLNSLVTNLTLPATVFLAVRNIQRESWRELVKVPLVAYLVIAACGGLAFVAARWLRLERRTAGALIITAMLGSTAFLGYPLVRGLFGEKSQGYAAAVFYSEVGTLIPILTVAVVIASHYGEGERFSWRNLLAVLKFGPFVAFLIGLLFLNEAVPEVLLGMLRLLSQATVPLIMLSLGITISWGDFFGRHIRGILATSMIKLLVAPLLAVVLTGLLGLSGEIRSVTILMSALPSLMLCLAYANQYHLDVEFASSALFASFFLGALTLPIVAALIPR
jgi:predicted permease